MKRNRPHAYMGLLTAFAAALFFAGCGSVTPDQGKANMSITITSGAFSSGQSIPKKHTGEGADVSPPLQWTGVPKNAVDLALICDDPDAPPGDWVHWVVYNLPPETAALPEGIPAEESPKEPAGARHGKNDFGKTAYSGPMPPPGHGVHHYHFKLYALGKKLDLPPGKTKKELLEAMKGHILAQGQLIGTYERK